MINRWEFPVNYPVFTVVMVIYHHVEMIGELLLPPCFSYNIYDHEKYYPGEPDNIHIQSLIDIIQEKNWGITTILSCATIKTYEETTMIIPVNITEEAAESVAQNL